VNLRVALITYSTKPRGGVVHHALACRRIGGGRDTGTGDRARRSRRGILPYCASTAPESFPAPPRADTLEQRVADSIDALQAGLARFADEVDIFHTQDCISARAAAMVRDAGAPVTVVRTVHHLDDFTTPVLIDCQRQSVLLPDRLIVPSEDWRRRLRDEFGTDAEVVYNGVDAARFGPIDPSRRAALRRESGTAGRFVFLAVGGVEPRKGTVFLFQALAKLVADRDLDPPPALAIIGGHSFQDYIDYRTKRWECCPTSASNWAAMSFCSAPSRRRVHEWYRSADALAFPSVRKAGAGGARGDERDLPVVAQRHRRAAGIPHRRDERRAHRCGRSRLAGERHAGAHDLTRNFGNASSRAAGSRAAVHVGPRRP
jgi:glycosyltransferase involved in cell wall biosynthesis